MTFYSLLWWVFAALAFGGGIGMVAGRTPVASLLSLVLTLFSTGVIFILLGAHFIGVVQVIVYAGAIMVLFLFVIMLLNLGHDYQPDLRRAGWIAGASVACGVLAWLIMRTFTHETTLVASGGGMTAAQAVEQHGAVGAVAMPMFNEYVVGFELTSLLLLAAIIGAIVLAKRRI
ncbi:MAG: NADH-quinone oxidoreductase subunit J [Gemmatimonadetes bacterium]|nr:NADH-quinone oxidoreductase subunit J [Gemmatimonadota bacterium]